MTKSLKKTKKNQYHWLNIILYDSSIETHLIFLHQHPKLTNKWRILQFSSSLNHLVLLTFFFSQKEKLFVYAFIYLFIGLWAHLRLTTGSVGGLNLWISETHGPLGPALTVDLSPPPDFVLTQGYPYGRYCWGKGFKCYMTWFFFFRFRIYYRITHSQGQFGGDIVPSVLAQFIIMMHRLGRLFCENLFISL